MLPAATPATDKREWLILAAGLAAVLAWLALRNHGLYPAIFADEWYYSRMSRLQPLAEAIVPSYLYLWLFSATSACGTGFYDCARFGNVLLYVGAGPFIYMIGRQVARPVVAIAITLLCLMGPFNLYTAFFMPEATYYFGVLVLSWMLLTQARWGWARLALSAGLVLGMMSLVKVHALFLLPGLCLFLVIAARMEESADSGGDGADDRSGRGWLREGAGAALVLAASALAVKFGLGYVLAGDAGLSLFGSFYGSTASSSAGSKLGLLAAAGFINGRGHLMALAILLPLPMAILLQWVLSRATREAAALRFNRLALYAFLMLGSAAGMTVAYTASIAGVGPQEVLRLHLRYYSFTFPLLLLLAGAAFSMPALRTAAPRARVAAAVLVGAAIVAALALLPHYALAPIDSPEITSIDVALWSGWMVGGLGLLALALWAFGQQSAASLFLFVLLPTTVALGAQLTTAYLAQIVSGWAPDHAGIAARDHVPRQERNQITIAASREVDIMRAQFHIDDNDSAMLELAPGAPIESYQLPVRKKWLLVIGQHPLPADVKPVIKTGDYALVRLAGEFHPIGAFQLSQELVEGGLLTRMEGLSHAEGWGRWSDGKQVALHFARPLPKQLDLILKGRAYADNAGLPFTVRVGEQSATFRLPGSVQEARLRLTTDGTQRILTIDVPKPISPKARGEWPDPRELGIGLVEIAIGNSADQ